jgi:hypothetical protein
MLVRALKVLGYFRNETTYTDTDTAALDQPGDEGCAYGRANPDLQRRTTALSCFDASSRGTRRSPKQEEKDDFTPPNSSSG